LKFSYLTNELVFLYTHFRHGARGPTSLNNTNFLDTIGEKWTELGELTGIGERMHYLLGLRNRKKYIEEEKFLDEKFNPHQMLIYSTAVNRTLVSCASQLQGWYPQRAQMGEVLTPKQEKKSYPPILEGNEDKYKNIIEELNNSSLPYRMMLAPIRMYEESELYMNLQTKGECIKKLYGLVKGNEKKKEISDYIEIYNENYAKNLSNFYNNTKSMFGLEEIGSICGDFICDYTEDREMSEFKSKTGINLTVFLKDCLEFKDIYYSNFLYGDKDNILAHLISNKSMRQFLFYMKRKLKAIINKKDDDTNYADYSRPRLVMNSGHDITLAADLMFLFKLLNINITENFNFPRFASQFAIEVRKNKENCTKFSDFNIIGDYNGKIIFNMTVEFFLEKIENEIWTEDKLNDFCGINPNNNNDNTNSNNEDNSDKKLKIYKIITIVLISLSVVFIVIIIILACKLCKKKDSWISPLNQNLEPDNQNNIENNNVNE